MSETCYWVAPGTIGKRLRAELARGAKEIDAINRWARKQGGTAGVNMNAWFSSRFEGVKFAAVPDPTLWKKSKHGNFFEPRHSTKGGKALAAEMKGFDPTGGAQIASIIGMKIMNGCSFRSPGCGIVAGRVILSLPPDVKPAGCFRISDLDYEAMQRKDAQQKKPRRKTAHQ